MRTSALAAALVAVLFHGAFAADSSPPFLLQWGSQGTGPGQFSNPVSVHLDENGLVYVADLSNHRIQVFDMEGNHVDTWGTPGMGDGQFLFPYDAVTHDGFVYVADSVNDRIQKLTLDGSFVSNWGGAGSGDGQFE